MYKIKLNIATTSIKYVRFPDVNHLSLDEFLKLEANYQEPDPHQKEHENILEDENNLPNTNKNKILSKQKLINNMERYTLVDCREEKEFLVSHIPNSLLIGDFEKLIESEEYRKKLPNILIFYCSIGYRSSIFSRKHKNLGSDTRFEVYNLHGGIFEYANNCHAVVDCKNKLMDKVHGYDQIWSSMLKPEYVYLD